MEKQIMCQYFGCKQPATLRIERANANVCDDHYALNVLRFGCVFKASPIKQPEQQPAADGRLAGFFRIWSRKNE